MDRKTDEQLLTDFVGGDRSALGELARRYEPPLLGFVNGFLGGREDVARDTVQETWVRVIRYADRFSGRSSLKTWLYRIALNQARTMMAVGNSCKPAQEKATGEPVEQSAFAAAAAAESSAELRDVVESMCPNHRAVLLLCYHDGMKHQEVADVLEIPVGTVKSRLNAALNELRARLKPETLS